MLTLTVPFPPSILNPNKKTHWSVKSKSAKTYKNTCFMLAKERGIKIDWDGDIVLKMVFYPPDRRHRDDDNMIASFKSGRDGIADALGINDRRFRINPSVSRDIGGYVQLSFEKSTTDGQMLF